MCVISNPPVYWTGPSESIPHGYLPTNKTVMVNPIEQTHVDWISNSVRPLEVLKATMLNLSDKEQQELYEFLHYSLNCRIYENK